MPEKSLMALMSAVAAQCRDVHRMIDSPICKGIAADVAMMRPFYITSAACEAVHFRGVGSFMEAMGPFNEAMVAMGPLTETMRAIGASPLAETIRAVAAAPQVAPWSGVELGGADVPQRKMPTRSEMRDALRSTSWPDFDAPRREIPSPFAPGGALCPPAAPAARKLKSGPSPRNMAALDAPLVEEMRQLLAAGVRSAWAAAGLVVDRAAKTGGGTRDSVQTRLLRRYQEKYADAPCGGRGN